ncbi:hypothetical protein YC2023_098805 [Brassica napus]
MTRYFNKKKVWQPGLGFESQAIQFIADCTFLQLSILNKIKPHKTAWRIQVKITHTWRHFMKDVGESMELILCDANLSIGHKGDYPTLLVASLDLQYRRSTHGDHHSFRGPWGVRSWSLLRSPVNLERRDSGGVTYHRMGSTFHMKPAHQADLNGKGILYEDDDEPVKLIDRDDSFVIKEFGLTLIEKIINPKKQNVEKLLQTMPSQWGLAERIMANDLGNGKFLFNFTNEEDLNYVMAKGPFHFNFCMFVLVRWEPIVHDDYPWIIPFWTDANLRNIGGQIGHIDTMELTEGRMLIYVDSRRPLKFSRKVEYEGDEVTIEIKYDLLFKHCTTCGMLSHEKGYCPSIGARQPTLERADVFTRMQLPVRHNGRDNQNNDCRHHQPLLEIREPHSRTYAEYMPRRDLRINLREGNDRQSRSWDDNRRLGS